MPAVVEERFRTVEGGSNTRRLGYRVTGAVSDNDALDATETTAPLVYDNMPRETVEISEVRWPDVWFTTAIYSRATRPIPASGVIEYSFDYATSTQKIIQSISTINRYVPAGGALTDFAKAIAVDADGVPQGIDILVPVGSFELRYYPVNATVSDAYKQVVRETVGKVNSATFKGHPAGEVLFTGCSGSIRSGADWELSYRFNTIKNRTGVSIGTITGISVKGWEVLWVYYKQAKDATSKRYIQIPKQVNVEQVYETADLGTVLGI